MQPDPSTKSSPTSLQIVREAERLATTALSRTTWWRLERAGLAPKRVRLGANSIGWIRSEINRWIEERAAARR